VRSSTLPCSEKVDLAKHYEGEEAIGKIYIQMPIIGPPRYTPPEPLSKMRLYHITHWHNLRGIIEQQGMWCGREIKARKLNFISAAHPHIQQRRAEIEVKVENNETLGTLPDYVPWSFARRQPMLCAIHYEQIENQQVKQRDMIHLITSFGKVKSANLAWAIADGHPAVFKSKFFNSESDFNRIDWPLMKEDFWNNTEEDGDRTRRRQAEFLIHSFSPWILIDGIATMNEEIANHVRELIIPLEHQPPVQDVSDWYY